MASAKKMAIVPSTSFRLSDDAKTRIGAIADFYHKNRTEALESAIEHEAMRVSNRCVCTWSRPAMRPKPCKTCNGFGVVAVGIQTQQNEKPQIMAWISAEGMTPGESLLAYVSPAVCPDCKGKGGRG